MKKFKKSEYCHRCLINYATIPYSCTYCNLCVCMPCYWHYAEIDEKYKIKVNRLPCGFVEVTCHNCRESQRVMNKIDCWLAVHGSDK